MTPALRRTVELLFLARVPVVALALALAAYAGDDRLALDFHHEVYRQADAVVHGERCLRRAGCGSLRPRELPVADGRGAPRGAAHGASARRGRLARDGARDRGARRGAVGARGSRLARVRGRPPLAGHDRGDPDRQRRRSRSRCSSRSMWRYRDRAAIAGIALGYGVAIKLFLWPVVVWLALVGRRSAAAHRRRHGRGVAPPAPAVHEHRRLRPPRSGTSAGRSSTTSYTPFALLTDLGVPDTAARAMTVALGSGRARPRVAPTQPWARPRGGARACRRSCGATSSSS